MMQEVVQKVQDALQAHAGSKRGSEVVTDEGGMTASAASVAEAAAKRHQPGPVSSVPVALPTVQGYLRPGKQLVTWPHHTANSDSARLDFYWNHWNTTIRSVANVETGKKNKEVGWDNPLPLVDGKRVGREMSNAYLKE